MPRRPRPGRRPAIGSVVLCAVVALVCWAGAVLEGGVLPWVLAFTAATVAVVAAFSGRRRV
ncbi:hypothetical protein ACFQ46_04225 [Kineococcus sp. GCM10028916]|uniref:hypothetical protein n=1 Tax=Kineococcus sp. GCM10028916 TaxID=3273394 RepID=UPI003626ED63